MSFVAKGKTNLKYILIVVILVTLASIVALFYWWQTKTSVANMPQTLEVQKTTEAPKPLDTSNWKIYKDETSGFEFRYPAEWFVMEDSGRYLFYDSLTSCNQGICATKKSQMDFGVKNNINLMPISEWMKQNIPLVGIETDSLFSANSFEGIRRVYHGINNSAILVIFSQRGKVNPLYYFETSGRENLRILNEILASFKV